MNAIQFIKLYGLHSARVTVEDAQENTHYCTETGYHSIKLDVAYEPCPDCVSIPDLKRLVESVELVKEHYTLDRAIEYANSQYTAPEIKVCLLDAIANYKSIYSDNNMGDDSHIENHVSPLCKMGVK